MTGRPGRRLQLVCTLATLVSVVTAGCREERPAIVIQESTVAVENQSNQAWSNIEVWLNDHYRVTARTLEPGGRLVMPLDTFVAGFGQRFDRRRQTPFGIEVTARTAAGEVVRIVWGKGRRR